MFILLALLGLIQNYNFSEKTKGGLDWSGKFKQVACSYNVSDDKS